ncbi:Fc.00g028090.m01.CDS01 [Cosmosporella sp. VM-42]
MDDAENTSPVRRVKVADLVEEPMASRMQRKRRVGWPNAGTAATQSKKAKRERDGALNTAPPDAYESRYYYHGMGGLLAGPKTRRFFTIGEHRILDLWSGELIRSLQLALEGIDWRRFYPIRIVNFWGHKSPIGPDRDLVLVIEVPPDSLDWATGIQVALRCRNVLRQANVLGIEVEIREIGRNPFALDAQVERLAEALPPARKSDWLSNFSYEALQPFLSNNGYEIVPENETPVYLGTMGLHIRLSGRPGEFYGYTCRHVAHRPAKDAESSPRKPGYWIPNREGYHLQDESETRHLMLQMCLHNFDTDTVDMKAQAEQQLKAKRELSMKQMIHDLEPSRPSCSEKELEQLKALDLELPFAQQVSDSLNLAAFSADKDRAIGYITDMPPLEVSKRGFFRDWALIRLDEAKFAEPPTNKVFFPSKACELLESLGESDGEWKKFLDEKVENKRKVRLQGTLSLADIHARKSLRVAKRGAKTELTFGETNEIKAIVRNPTSDSPDMITWEWIVVGVGVDSDAPGAFTQPGDSGASVFDLEGRVIGFVGSGFDPKSNNDGNPRLWKHYKLGDEELPVGTQSRSKANEKPPEGFRRYDESTDLTFITPIDVVIEDIRQETGCEMEII